MAIRGSELKKIIRSGLSEHDRMMTLDLTKVLSDFSDRVDEDADYDLFFVFSQLILNANEDIPPLLANLMTCANWGELEHMDEHFMGTIGYYFRDTLKKGVALKYFSDRGLNRGIAN